MMKRTFCDFMELFLARSQKAGTSNERGKRILFFSKLCVDDARSCQISLYHITLCVCCWISMNSSSPKTKQKKEKKRKKLQKNPPLHNALSDLSDDGALCGKIFCTY